MTLQQPGHDAWHQRQHDDAHDDGGQIVVYPFDIAKDVAGNRQRHDPQGSASDVIRQEGGIAQARLGRAGVLRDQVLVGEDHVAEQVEQEVALLAVGFLVLVVFEADVEALRHALGRCRYRLAFLQGPIERALDVAPMEERGSFAISVSRLAG